MSDEESILHSICDDSVRHLSKPVFRGSGGLVYMSLKYLTLKMETFISVYACAYNLYES